MLNEIDLVSISTTAILVAVGTIGLTQLVKNFFKDKKGKKFAVLSTLFTALICIINTSLVSSLLTVLVDTFILSLAMTQLAWDVLAQAVPNAVSTLLDKMLNNINHQNKKERK